MRDIQAVKAKALEGQPTPLARFNDVGSSAPQAARARSEFRLDTEEKRIAFDLSFSQYKASGRLKEDEIRRAHLRELDAGLHNLHEPFEGLIR